MNKIVREIFDLGRETQKTLSVSENIRFTEEAYEVWEKFINDKIADVDKFYGYKDVSEVSDSLPECRIRAYNARQRDRREGADFILAMLRDEE